jgi:glucokinase
MSALPIISTAVSAVGLVSNISQQRQAAALQASAIDDERTNAVIQAELTAAQQKQQYLIASTQQKIEAKQSLINYELVRKQADLTRAEYDSQLENTRTLLDVQRVSVDQQLDDTQSQLELQRLEADTQLLGTNAQTQEELVKAQLQVDAPQEGELDFASQVNLANRMNRFTGSSTIGEQRSYEEFQRQRNADVDELEVAKESSQRVTDEQMILNQQLQAQLANVAQTEAQKQQSAIETSKQALQNDESTANRTLEEFKAALENALASNLSDQELQSFLLTQSNTAAERARELGLNAQLVSLQNQQDSIRRPGILEFLSGGVNIFSTYQQMSQQQERIGQINQRTQTINNRSVQPPDAVNPYYNRNPGFTLPTPTEGLVIPSGEIPVSYDFIAPGYTQADNARFNSYFNRR